jgi:hypothetical protein
MKKIKKRHITAAVRNAISEVVGLHSKTRDMILESALAELAEEYGSDDEAWDKVQCEVYDKIKELLFM